MLFDNIKKNAIKVANKIFPSVIYIYINIFVLVRRSLFWLKLGTFQFALFRPVFMFLSTVLWTNGNYSLSNVSEYFNQRWSTEHIAFGLIFIILASN